MPVVIAIGKPANLDKDGLGLGDPSRMSPQETFLILQGPVLPVPASHIVSALGAPAVGASHEHHGLHSVGLLLRHVHQDHGASTETDAPYLSNAEAVEELRTSTSPLAAKLIHAPGAKRGERPCPGQIGHDQG